MDENNGSDQKALDYSLKYNTPMDPIFGERNLKEAQQILADLNVPFLLGSGSCLGAIREKGFIAWDDDVDLFSVIGEGDTTEETADIVATRGLVPLIWSACAGPSVWCAFVDTSLLPNL